MTGDIHDHRQHQGRDGDVVHDCGHDTGCQHNDDNHAHFTVAGQSQDNPADGIGYPCKGQTAAENENRPHGDHGRIAETRQCLNRADETGNGNGAQRQQGGNLHRYPFGNEKQDGDS